MKRSIPDKSIQGEINIFKALLNNIGKDFDIDSIDNSKCHPYGSCNLVEYKCDFSCATQSIITTLNSLESKVSEFENKMVIQNNDITLQQILKTTKDSENEKTVYNKLQTALDSCRVIGMNYLENNRTTYHDISYSIKDRIKVTVATIPGFIYDEMNEEEYLDIFVVGGNSISLEVRLLGDNVESVTYSVVNEEEPEKLDFLSDKILELLKERNFEEFEKLLRRSKMRVEKLDKLEAYEKSAKSILYSIEADLEKVGLHELSIFGNDCLTQAHGIIKKYYEGYLISFWKKWNQQRQNNNNTLIEDKDLYYTGLISIEMSSQPTFLSQFSQISQLNSDGSVNFHVMKQNQNESMNISFVMILETPISISIAKFNQILSLSNLSMPSSYANGNQRSLLREELNIGELRLIFVLTQSVSMIEIQRIPFLHISNLLPIIQILRQQLMINELIDSCFIPSNLEVLPFGITRVSGITGGKRKFSNQSSTLVTMDVELADEAIGLKMSDSYTTIQILATNTSLTVNSTIENFDHYFFINELTKTKSVPHSLHQMFLNK